MMPKYGEGWMDEGSVDYGSLRGLTNGERLLQHQLRRDMFSSWLRLIAFGLFGSSVFFAIWGRLELATYLVLLGIFLKGD